MRNFRILFAFLAIVINLAESFGQICSKEQLPLSLQQGLIAYYPFCGDYTDKSGNGYNGTVQGGSVPFITDRFGNSSSAVQLGVGYISASTAVFNYQRTDQFTISIWFTKDNNNPSGRLLSTECPEGNFRMGAGYNGEYAVQYGDYIFDTVPIATWTHLVYTYDNRNEKVYINGVLKYTNYDVVTEGLNYCAPFTIGAKASSAFDRWVGKADDIAVYNRAITLDEVASLYGLADDCLTFSQTNLLSDTTTLFGSTPKLSVEEGYSSYVWNNGDTSSTIYPEIEGAFIVTVTDSQGCSVTDTTSVKIVKTGILASDTLICSPQNITLSIRNYASGLTDALNTGLVGNYPFDGNANDLSGSNRHLQQFGVEASSDRFGNSNGSLLFQNQKTVVTDYLRATNDEDFKFKKYTFSFWLNTSSFYQVGSFWDPAYQGIISFSPKYWNLAPSYSIGLSINDNSQIGMEHWTPTSGNAAGTPFGTIQLGQWNHIGVTYDSSTIRFYFNGQLIDSADAILAYVGQTDFLIGARGDGPFPGGYFGGFNGKMDDLMIWDRALSGDDIGEIYQTQQAGPLTTASILWSTGDTTPVISVIPQADTTITVDVVKGDISETFSIDLKVGSSQSFNPFSDTTIVKGESAKLNAGSGYVSYSWNTGDTSSSIDANKTGLYITTVQTQEGCSLSDSTFLILNNLKIVASDTILCDTATINLSVPVDLGTFKYVGSFGESDYYIDSVSRSWPLARAAAQAQGMDLWVIDNQVENDSVYNRLPHAENVYVNYWIGLYQDRNGLDYSEPFGGWKWVDGSTLSFTNWLGGEPNNQSGFSPFYEDYGIMWTTPYHGKWNDYYSEIQDPGIIGQFKTLAVVEKPRRKYSWSTGDTTATIAVKPIVNTDYILTVEENGIIFSDTITIKVSPKVEFNPLPDTLSVCGESALLDAGAGYQSYIWNTGDKTAQVNVGYSGLFSVLTTDINGCISADTTLVNILKVQISDSDTSICLGDSIRLSVTGLSSHNPIIDNFLLAHYTLNGNIQDVKGNFNGGSTNAIFVKDRFGIDSSAIQFNGVSTKVSIGQSNSLTKLPLSIGFWSKIPENGGGQVFSLAMGETFVNTWAIYMSDSSIYARYTPFNQSNISLLEGSSNFQFAPGNWYHILVSFDSTSGLTIYVDGNQVLNSAWKESPKEVSANYALNIGFYPATLPGGGYRFFKGELDDIKIYRKALSAEQIREIIYGSFSYVWSTGEVAPTISVKPKATTTYTVRSTNGVNECTDQVTITVNSVDTSLTVLDPTAICLSDSTRLQAGSGSAYVWLKDGSVIDGAVSSLYTASSAGSYRVIVTNASGCSDTSRAVTISIKDNPDAGTWNSLVPVCSGVNSTSLTVSNSIGQLVWQQSTNGTTYVDIANLADSSYQAINLSSTRYYRVIATNSCGSDTSVVQTVVVNPTPVVSFTVNSASQSLSGNLFVFTNTTAVTTGDTYLWDLGNGFTNTSRNISFTYAATGTYIVSLTVRSALGCESTVQQNIQVVDLPESGLISGSVAVCGPVNSNILSVSGSSGTLQWQQSANNLTFININGESGTSYTASNLSSTTYFRAIATKNGLYDTSAVAIITVNPKPIPSFTVNTAAQVLTNNSFVFTNTSTGGSTYLWRFGNGVTATTQNATYSYPAAGSYVVRLIVTTAAGCKDSTSSTVTVTAPPPPPPVVSGNLFAQGTTCAQFNGNVGSALTRLCYTVSSGRVNAVTPASFMYYVKVTAPSASFTVNIAQTVSRSGFRLFTVNTGGSVASGDNCARVTSVSSPSTGQARVSITRATVGRTYIIGVRYDTRSLVGYGTNGTLNTSYGFSAKIGNTTLPNSTGSVMLYPNNCVGVSGGQVTSRLPELGGLPGAAAGVDKTGSDTRLQIRVYPNPSNSRFTVLIESNDRHTKGTLRIMTAQGQVVEEFKEVQSGTELHLGMNYISGTYTAVFIQGNQTTRQRMVKY